MNNTGNEAHTDAAWHKANELLPLVYDELRRLAAKQLARERPGQTLDATGLVHEAYLRLQGSHEFAGRSHFFRTAAEAMRRILIDRARQQKSLRRGGAIQKFELREADGLSFPEASWLLPLDEALTQLAERDPQAAELARLRLFAGLSVETAAEVLGISRATAFRDWSFARAFLATAVKDSEN